MQRNWFWTNDMIDDQRPVKLEMNAENKKNSGPNNGNDFIAAYSFTFPGTSFSRMLNIGILDAACQCTSAHETTVAVQLYGTT
eukprot:scaffold7794_cov62-Cyclotella_meneghiniana.AAC.1